MKIVTQDSEGRVNGWLMPIWNALEQPELRPDQVYVTAIAPHCRKGPHLHMARVGRFFCVAGSVTVRMRTPKQPEYEYFDGKLTSDAKAIIQPRIACALYNYGDTEALVLNLPSPAWSKENPDDHPVTDWKDPVDWPPRTQPPAPSCSSCKHAAIDHDSGGCCRVNFCSCQDFRRSE